MSRLLNKPFKVFTTYALIILASSIPIYYWVLGHIRLSELDEHNHIMKERFLDALQNKTIEEGELPVLLENWSLLQPNTSLTPSHLSYPEADSSFTITKHSQYNNHKKTDRFRVLVSHIWINKKLYRLEIETNVEETHETILAIAMVTLLFFFLLILGFIILNVRLTKTLWEPFQNTLQKLKSFDLTTEKNIEFIQTDIEEFEELNQSLHNLIAKNISVYKQQKTFIENASHELQTPLAVLKSKLSMLMQSENITWEQYEIINAIELPLSRISRINKNLLLLAKIENNQFSNTETMELTQLIHETIELLGDYISNKKIAVETNINEKLNIICNRALLEILITNLLINAIIHNIENSKICIDFNSGILTISNKGKTALDSKNIFERFSVSSHEKTSSGLGLAIVKEICTRYKWQLKYNFQNQHHTFSVCF